MSMTMILLVLVSLVLLFLLVLVFSPFLLSFILLLRTFGYEMSKLATLIAWPLLVSSLSFITKVSSKLVATLDDSLEASYEHGNVLIFIIETIIFTSGSLINHFSALTTLASS